MLVDEESSEPVLFLEKVSSDEILKVLKSSNKRSVYFNAFYFAMSKQEEKPKRVDFNGSIDQKPIKSIEKYSINKNIRFDQSENNSK